MRGIEIFQKPSYREISPMRDRPMRGPPVYENRILRTHNFFCQNCTFLSFRFTALDW